MAAGVKTVLSVFGGDVKKVWSWITSPTGQKVIQAGEGVAETIDPGLTGIITLANNWMAEIIKTEALAAAAGSQGSGTEKAAEVMKSVTPQAIQYAQANGLPAPTAAKLQAANDALVIFFNAFEFKG